MEGFGFFNDPDLQRRIQEMMEQMQGAQSLAWADNAIQLAVNLTVAAINRINLQGSAEDQAEQIRRVMAVVFPEAVTLVREARQGLSCPRARTLPPHWTRGSARSPTPRGRSPPSPSRSSTAWYARSPTAG